MRQALQLCSLIGFFAFLQLGCSRESDPNENASISKLSELVETQVKVELLELKELQKELSAQRFAEGSIITTLSTEVPDGWISLTDGKRYILPRERWVPAHLHNKTVESFENKYLIGGDSPEGIGKIANSDPIDQKVEVLDNVNGYILHVFDVTITGGPTNAYRIIRLEPNYIYKDMGYKLSDFINNYATLKLKGDRMHFAPPAMKVQIHMKCSGCKAVDV